MILRIIDPINSPIDSLLKYYRIAIKFPYVKFILKIQVFNKNEETFLIYIFNNFFNTKTFLIKKELRNRNLIIKLRIKSKITVLTKLF